MTANPYPGLRSFEASDGELFFGRERETDDLRRCLRRNRFVAVVGASGSGKSSLVRCGLIPSLHAGLMSGAGSRWRVALLRPGDDPFAALAAALDAPGVLDSGGVRADTRRTVLEAGLHDSSLGLSQAVRHAALPPGDEVLVVVDQFEELFRYARSRQADGSGGAAAFVQLLLEATRVADVRVHVVITMRAEFIGDCMAFAGLPEAINGGQYLVPALSRDAMRAAIGKPAQVSGTTIAPRLMVRLLNEVADAPDCLPVLQHALMRTWDRWSVDHAPGEPVDVRHYEAVGTVREALSRHADEAWQALQTPARQELAERLFKALTETTEDGRGLRRPLALARLQAVCGASADELKAVIEVFRAPGRAFLQPAAGQALQAGTIIDISHESLMRLWQRLVEWAREEARASEMFRRLLRGARQHAAGESSLWRPPELTLGRRWRRENPAARQLHGEADVDAVLQFLRRSERAHWLRNGLAALAVVLAVAAVLGTALREARRQQALAEARRAEIVALQAELQRLGAAKAEAAAAQQRQLEDVTALRSTHAGLKQAVEALDTQRLALLPVIARLREGNRAHEARLALLATEQGLLEARSDGLRDDIVREQARHGDLEERIAALQGVPATLAEQRRQQQQRVDGLRARQTELKQLFIATQPCDWREVLAPAGAVAAGSVVPPPAPRGAATPRVPVPDDPSDADALRRRIEALARELAELVDARARLQDEAAWLHQANALLVQQRDALQQELAQLQGVQRQLQRRQEALLANLRIAEADRQTLLAFIATQEQERGKWRDRVARLAKDHAALEQQAVRETGSIGALNSSAQRLQDENRLLVDHMAPIVDRLLAHAAGAGLAPDLAALLAIKAYRWAPYDTDAATQPAVYNGLWLALRRVDAAQAAALLSPGDPQAGKLATTRSAVMVQALCARIARPITEAEWRRYLPDGACFSPEAARVCFP